MHFLQARSIARPPFAPPFLQAARLSKFMGYFEKISPRRIAFNEEGIFRHYPELDAVRKARRALALA